MIDHETGALTVREGRISPDITRSAFATSPMAAGSSVDDMRTGWAQVTLAAQVDRGWTWGVRLLFDGERLDGYRLWIADARFGVSWDDWSEDKELARRDAQDAWLVEQLGEGVRIERPSGSVLTYSLPWGEAWSGYDPRSAGSDVGVRLRR